MKRINKGNQNAASPGVRPGARSRARQALAGARGTEGSAIVEFALLTPLLMLTLVGIITFGVAMNTQITLTTAANLGAQALSTSRGQTTNPCTTTTGPVYAAAPNLAQNNLKFSIAIAPPSGGSGTSYTLASGVATPTCAATSTTTAPATDLVQGDVATVTLTYPCNLSVYGHNYAPSCTLTAQTAEVVQ